jgi:uncharacterized NAD(P)/FAD-binding protein YdhS
MTIAQPPHPRDATVIVVGGGFSGSLFALKLSRAWPKARIMLIERAKRAGRGLAYGACTPDHLLNVPVSRMEVGLDSFEDWLATRHRAELADALEESGHDLTSAFVQRELFGDYVEDHVSRSCALKGGLCRLRGEVVRLMDYPGRGVILADGREIEADLIVLATGNMPPRLPAGIPSAMLDSDLFVADPWAHDAFDDLDANAPVLVLGTGLTMVDVVLKLARSGHQGQVLALSRRGLLPRAHRAGGAWQPFLEQGHSAPSALVRRIRAEVRSAERAGIPWQRVIDQVRPQIARIWQSWSLAERKTFLRHLQTRWDVFRHRMAPRVAALAESMMQTGRLRFAAGRVQDYREAGGRAELRIVERNTRRQMAFVAARVVNCTGPRSDYGRIAIPLFADLIRRGVITPDTLGLGIETSNCAVVSASGRASTWLYALGPLTRPAYWEITAVPEINAQVDRLVQDLSSAGQHVVAPPLAEIFAGLGEGI